MYARELTSEINASPEAVYDYLADFSKHPEWAAQPMEMHVDGPVPTQRGTKFHTRVKFMGNVAATGEVTEAQRPSRLVYECEDTSGHWRWTFEIKPSGAGSSVTHRCERLRTPLLTMLMSPFAWPLFGRKMVSGGLANLKSRLETGVRSA